MKAIRKLTAIILSMAMLVVLAIPAFAAEAEKTITINNATNGHTYNAYQLFDVTYSGDAYTYTIAGTSVWYTFISGKADVFTLTASTDSKYVVTAVENANMATFAKDALAYAKANSIGADATAIAADGSAVITVSADGYYLVDTTVGSICILTTTDPVATVTEKNAAPSLIKQTSDSNDTTLDDVSTTTKGGTVDFTITITVPAPGATNVSLFDKMEDGLTLVADSIKVNNATTGDFTITKGTNDFQIDFADTLTDIEAGTEIVVTYSATLSADALVYDSANAATNYKNIAYLKYGDNNTKEPESNVDPEDPTTVPVEPGTSTPDVTETRTFDLPVLKFFNDGGTETGLEGAKFTFSLSADGTNAMSFTVADNEYTNVAAGTDGATSDLESSTDGKFTIIGLQAGTYYLTETAAPDGYNKLTSPVTIVITENGDITQDGVAADPIKVENKSGAVLPETGATGTMIFTLVGAALIGVTGVLMITRKKMSAYED